MATLDSLPDELILHVLCLSESIDVAARLAMTSRRYLFLVADRALWKHMCLLHFGPPLHEHFEASGKDWRWLYQAQSRAARSAGADVGGVIARGRVYWGDTMDGLPHGYGLGLYLPTRHRACGAAVRIGRGLAAASVPPNAVAGSHYEGQWCNGLMHGHGHRLYKDGSRYEGEYRDDKRQGHGAIAWPDGRRYEGEWHDDKKHGHGAFTWPHGERYEGGCHDDKRHGHGVYVCPNGERYEGEWHDDKVHGHGSYVWPNGNRYEGGWHDGERQGYGVLTWSNGNQYAGAWHNGNRHGYGVSTWTSAGRRGHQQHGRESPIDPRTSVDSQQHNGIWHNDRAHGPGVLTYTDGSALRGVWCDAVLTNADVVRHCAKSCVEGVCACAAGRAVAIASHVSVLP
ncbi:Morn repeat protein [Pandoravirus kuranda]|uniref:Morn repeat protein n=2 Tax=Pandoravirus TaxID=2060084 RepID=A0AA95EN56_9VIRU|nr:Morn repeat domain containing protein [Pandoravirus neocaledonia]AVK76071.1 Morn repeat domain containing protein [Pandoravirus neocaledonia]WBR14606.1 Morn repeat protein [Pandoravirus kuranda]